MPKPVVAVVVGAGLGVRYGGPVPKPALTMTGRTLLVMSVEAMAAGGCTHAVLVLSDSTRTHLGAALKALPIPVYQVNGGLTRQQSVYNGLKKIAEIPELADAGTVLIHDAVRPMVPANVVSDVIQAVADGAEAVAPAIRVADSMRLIDDGGVSAIIDRDRLRSVQTPQGFPIDVITSAHERAAAAQIECTDDVSCAEFAGHQVTLVPGSRLSMKITEPTDMTVARALWKARSTLGHHSGRRIFRHLGR